MDTSKILKIAMIFLIGFLTSNLINMYFVYGFEIPANMPSLNGIFTGETRAPTDFIKENQIKVYDDRIVIYVDNPSLSRYAPTGSMRPVLDSGSNGIRIVPESIEDIGIGDIITFKQDNLLIVHRVIDKGIDNNGTYFITKGDNNPIGDGKVRFVDIKYKTVGILW